MTHYRLKSNFEKTSFLLSTSDNNYCNQNNKPNTSHYNQTREKSIVGSDTYNTSLRKAFARAKLLAFFNPQLNTFITLTYKSNLTDPQQVIQDIKLLVKNHNNSQTTTHTSTTPTHTYREESPPPPHAKEKKPTKITAAHRKLVQELSTGANPNSQPVDYSTLEKDLKNFTKTQLSGKRIKKNEKNPFQYIYVMEYQKRGAIHVHMVANDVLEYTINKNGYRSVKHWPHGFSSVLKIEDVDINFKPYLYLFKYMTKAQRIGSSFVHISKNFDKIEVLDYRDYIDHLKKEDLLYTEDQEFKINETTHRITKNYYRQKAKENS